MNLIGTSSVTLALVMLALLGSGCERQSAPQGPIYADQPERPEVQVVRLAVHPLHNPARLLQAYQPLADYLNARLPGVRIEVEASRDYADFERKFRARASQRSCPTPGKP